MPFMLTKNPITCYTLDMLEIQPRDTSRGHFYVSLVKSATRIAAGIALIWPQSLILAGAFLIAAEVLGIVEEMV